MTVFSDLFSHGKIKHSIDVMSDFSFFLGFAFLNFEEN